MKKRGQISIEHLLILGILILIIVPIVIIIYSSARETSEEATEIMLEDLCNEIATKAETMENLGPNSWTTLDLKIPRNVEDISIAENEVIITYKAEGGLSSVVCFSEVNLEEANFGEAFDDIEPGGRVKIKIESKGNFVCVSGENSYCNITQCNDGIDNDGDLCIDRKDKGCYSGGSYDSSNDESEDCCVEPKCGNACLEDWGDTPEYCDGSWPGTDCLGFLDPLVYPAAHGELMCGPTCSANDPDTTNCGWCGDGIFTPLEEDCEPPNQFGGATCSDYTCNDGWGSPRTCNRGSLSCNSNDCTINSGGCWYQLCGNGVREGTEVCDGSDDDACSPNPCTLLCLCDIGGSPIFSKDPIPD